MLMDNCLFHFLHHRLSGRRISAVWAGVGKIDGLAFRADFLYLTSLYAAVRAEAAVKMCAAVFTDVQEHSIALPAALLYSCISVKTAAHTLTVASARTAA